MDVSTLLLGILIGPVLCAVLMGPWFYAISRVFRDLPPAHRQGALRRTALLTLVSAALGVSVVNPTSGGEPLFFVLVSLPFLIIYLGSLLQLRSANRPGRHRS